LLNTLSALVAKAGGTPWQIVDMPGETDAFMGLDVSYDSDTGQFTGASASMVLSDGTTFAAESTTQQGGEAFESDHVQQFIRDLVSDLAKSTNVNPSRIGLLRDGKVNEDIDTIRAGLTDLDAEIDVVSVRKNGQPRVGKFDGTSFKIAKKGHAFVNEPQNEAILHPFGKPEILDDNSSGTPRTIKLVKESGPTEMSTLAEQCYWLSEMHIGSPARSTRLPVPVKFADAAADYVSRGFASPGEVIRGPAFI
jgi:argonaute-like protein implicated in RNA metabolism and viral defense